MKLLLTLVFASSLWAVTDSITIYNSDTSTRTNLPFVIGRGFAKGEIPSGMCPSPGLTTWQFDLKNSWPDGSVKFGIISGIIPSLSNGGSVTYTISAASCPSTTPLTLSQMDTALTSAGGGGWGGGAQIQVTAASTTITSDAKTMLDRYDPGSDSFGDCKNDYWLQGPVVTAVIVQDCVLGASGAGNTTHWDFGWTWNGSTMATSYTCIANDCSTAANPASLHPWYILYFFPGGQYIRADMILENAWTNRAQDQLINVNYLTGSTPVSQLNYAGVPRKLTDVTMTTQSDIITSASASFTSNDIGSSIAINTDDTTICSIQSSTQATLCGPPFSSGTNVTAYINRWNWGQSYRKTFWTGAGNPGNYLVDHNWSYMVTTGMLPPYDPTKSASPDSQVYATDDCNASPSTGSDYKCFAQVSVTGAGIGPQTWSDTGDRGGHGRVDQGYSQTDGDPTPMSRQALLYLTNMSTCGTANGACAEGWYILTGTRGARDSSLSASIPGGAGTWGNSGNIPYHNRESRTGTVDTSHYFCPNLAAGVNANTGVGTGNNVANNSSTCGTSTDTPFGRPLSRYFDFTLGLPSAHPSGAVSSLGAWNPDIIRWLEWTYNAWLITGDYYFALDLQMNASYAMSVYNASRVDYGSNGFFSVANPKGSILRQTAGVTDVMGKAWAVSKDGSLEQTYWDSVLASNAETFEGEMYIQNGVGGYTSTLTPTSPNTTCSSYNIASTDRWAWGNCTLRSMCGSGEPQNSSCTVITQQLHSPVGGQNITGFTANLSAGVFTVAYAVAGTTTELVNWDGSGVTPSTGTKITITNATGGWTAINGLHTVQSTGTEMGVPCTSSPQGLSSCAYIIIDANTTGASQPLTGSVGVFWEQFGLVSSASTGSTTTITTSAFDSAIPVDIYGCVDQGGANWSGLNGVWTPTMVSSSSYSVPFNSTGFPSFSQSGCYWTTGLAENDKMTDQDQGWMEGMWGVVANELTNFGVSYYKNIAAELNKRYIEKIEDSSYNPFLIGKNFQPIKGVTGLSGGAGAQMTNGNGTANQMFSSWASVKAAMPPYAQTINTFWPSFSFVADMGSNPCTDHAYALEGRAMAAYLPGVTSGSFSGTAAWNWAKSWVPFFSDSTMDPGGNCGTSDAQIKWAFAPLSIPSTGSPRVSAAGQVSAGNQVN